MNIKFFKIVKSSLLMVLICSNVYANTDYFNEGLNLYNKNKFEKAKFKFEQDLVFNPKSENSYLYLSKIFNRQDKKKLEEQNLNSVILLNPKNEDAIYSLSKLKLEKSDYKASQKLVDQLLIICKNFCEKSKILKNEIEKSLKK